MKSYREVILENIKWKAKEGESELVYHSSPINFRKEWIPRIGTHFGSADAARSRAAEKHQSSISLAKGSSRPVEFSKFKGTAFTARIKLGNMIELPDLHSWNGFDLAKALRRKGHIDNQEFHKLKYMDDRNIFKYLNKNRNIDTIKYQNKHENKGSTSYITLNPANVRVLRKGKKVNLLKGWRKSSWYNKRQEPQ